ncbi:hypothetical protein CROQUDRAFT_652751 [Cronartium quercuum f. sp. fusiforme G11]|uniref:Uncharacterized protein n=1 Tax=Cronartium quercuum f. sp. fusiforme G11 TaxID=708437 RepID=A0A9P6TEY5_9BASI|nr:hypothetical protein CROQUDRAFT_652751 [Cronartium quercuum f. sp. fusiforme G11]
MNQEESDLTDTSSESVAESSENSFSSSSTARNHHRSLHLPTITSSHLNMSNSEDNGAKLFGNALQQFSQMLVSTLSKFSIKIILGDDNYTHWCNPVYEAIRTIGCRSYLDEDNYRDKSLTEEQYDQNRFVICTWILNQCDVTNGERARDELATRDPVTRKNEVDYDPYKLWINLETFHDRITEAKLAHVNRALINMTQLRSDNLKTHVEKFNALLRDYYRFRGDMTSAQAART